MGKIFAVLMLHIVAQDAEGFLGNILLAEY
jgi:hypothetical protein